jgi:hypothetical protein
MMQSKILRGKAIPELSSSCTRAVELGIFEAVSAWMREIPNEPLHATLQHCSERNQLKLKDNQEARH